jgi:hypothetical protein
VVLARGSSNLFLKLCFAAKPDFAISFERTIEILYSIQLQIEQAINFFGVSVPIWQSNLYGPAVAALDLVLLHNSHVSKNLHAGKSD